MKQFNTIEEAKEYGKNFSKHQFERVLVAGKERILCGTDHAYEEELWGDAYTLMQNFCKRFGNEDEDNLTEMATAIRDLVLERFTEEHDVEFVDVYDEY